MVEATCSRGRLITVMMARCVADGLHLALVEARRPRFGFSPLAGRKLARRVNHFEEAPN